VEPLTVQTAVVEDVKLTANDDVAVAESVIGVPTVPVAAGQKLMVCDVKAGEDALPPPQAARRAEVTSGRPAMVVLYVITRMGVSTGIEFASAV